jgi:hypothetical protein
VKRVGGGGFVFCFFFFGGMLATDVVCCEVVEQSRVFVGVTDAYALARKML